MMGGVLQRFRAARQHDRRRRRAAQPPPAALPAPARRLALPAPPDADAGPRCAACGYRHPPVRRSPTYATVIDGSLDVGRPRPLRDQAPAPIVRLNPWRL
jgi:hypothetical protein